MIRDILYLTAGAILLAGCVSVHKTERINEEKPTSTIKTQCTKKLAQVLRHVVLFKFKDDITNQQIRDIENAFCALPSKIDAIYDFEWGTDVSVENRSEGFTHCFVVTFLSEEDRGKYLPHPAHKDFGSMLRPHLDKVLVIDYWAKP
ncbi:MAG: Dabb family protein [Sedimentisphaerales bacterium]